MIPTEGEYLEDLILASLQHLPWWESAVTRITDRVTEPVRQVRP